LGENVAEPVLFSTVTSPADRGGVLSAYHFVNGENQNGTAGNSV
jgi:hypothetical protein